MSLVNGMFVKPSAAAASESAPLPARPDAFSAAGAPPLVVHEREEIAAHPAHVRTRHGDHRARGDRGVGRARRPVAASTPLLTKRDGRPTRPSRAARDGWRTASPAKLLSRRHACCSLRPVSRSPERTGRRHRLHGRSWDRRGHRVGRRRLDHDLDLTAAICLGTLDGRPCFARRHRYRRPSTVRLPLMGLWGQVDETMWTVAGGAVQLVEWERTHRFCGRCATPTEPAAGERARRCPGVRAAGVSSPRSHDHRPRRTR